MGTKWKNQYLAILCQKNEETLSGTCFYACDSFGLYHFVSARAVKQSSRSCGQQLLYVNNWWQINNGLSYFDRFANESPFTHIWSLAVEGQNYLVWPILFVLLMVFVRKRKWIFYTVLGTSFLSAILMMILYTPGGDPTRVYYGTDTRLFSIWLGSALAFVWPSTRLKKNIPKQAKNILNIAGGISLLALILCFFF